MKNKKQKQTTSVAPLLSVAHLQTIFKTGEGIARAVDDVSFFVHPGTTLALVGESGCGKSVTAMSLMRLIPSPPGHIIGGSALFKGKDLLAIPEMEMRRIRGNDISMIFQEPMTAMNPVFRIGDQITAVIQLHRKLDRASAHALAIEMMDRVGIPDAAQRARDYPHQMSGGMLQRVMIAMALSCDPLLLIADEPTTALDVTIQAQILELLVSLQEKTGMATILITHDLGVVAETAHAVAVMYAGKIVETAPVRELFATAEHPYTKALFASLPAMNRDKERLHTIQGQVPAATEFPEGCRFHPRCPNALPVCRKQNPPLKELSGGHGVACWLHHSEKERASTVVSTEKKS